MVLSQQHYVGFFLSLSSSSYWSGNGIVQALTPRSFREEGVQDAAKHLAMQVSNAAVAKADADIREAGRYERCGAPGGCGSRLQADVVLVKARPTRPAHRWVLCVSC